MTHDLGTRPPLDQDRLATLLDEAPLQLDVTVLPESPSTNAALVALALDGAPEGTVLVTEHQTAGRGRLDRVWETPTRAALTFSVLLHPTVSAADWPWVPLLAGYAVQQALRELGVPADLKWPNDIHVDGAKLGGILSERVETANGPAAVIGIGLNVSTTAEELPVETATSLALATGSSPDRTELLAALLGSLAEEYVAWQRARTDPLRAAYTDACVTIGQEVRVDLPSGERLTGTATGIDGGGRLVLATATGETTTVGAGDVVHVRPHHQ